MSALFRRFGITTGASAARAFSTTPTRPLARITVLGHLADSPEPITSPSGREHVRYTVASNSGPKANRVTSWFRITSFEEGPRRDLLLSLPKGSLVYVEGAASIDTWTGPDGKPRNAFKIQQRHLEVLKRPPTDEAAPSGEQHSEP